MKRALFGLIFALLPIALAAQVPDRDVLLTPDGTLYTIESIDNEGSSTSGVIRYLRLTIQRPNERQQTAVVPESLTAGIHWRPALAYDAASQTLFIFWLKMPNAMSSELLLASYASGTWHPAVSIDNQPYHLRYNLRIGITHKLALSDQTYGDVPMLLIHAIWWEETGYGENARYAMFGVQKGLISAIDAFTFRSAHIRADRAPLHRRASPIHGRARSRRSFRLTTVRCFCTTPRRTP